MLLEGLGQLKNTVTSWRIESMTILFVKKLKRLEFVQKITPSFDIADNVSYDKFVCIKQ
jgi:hypothetical protein